VGTSAVVIARGDADREELEHTLHACGATVRITTGAQLAARLAEDRDSTFLVAGEDASEPLAALCAHIPPSTRIVVVGPSEEAAADAAMPDCMLLDQPDVATLRAALEDSPELAPERLLELLDLGVFGESLSASLQSIAVRVARAFLADDCLILLPETSTCYRARSRDDASDAEVDEEVEVLVRVAMTVSRQPASVIAPERPGRRYRTFLAVPLGHDSAEPLAILLLCRERPAPFGRAAHGHLRRLVTRLAADLSSRIIHERLLEDRDRLRELSRVDPGLGIANRTGLQEELARRLTDAERRGEPLCVAVIDVDGLRLINERHGYPAGDEALTHVAQVARVEARMQDVVARYAAGAVALVLPATTEDQARELVTRILAAIDTAPVLHEGRPINLTVSAGIAAVWSFDDTGEAALGRAAAARQHARRHGEVIAVADPEMTANVAQPDYLVGTTLGGMYQIRHEISNGAFGVVYRAEDLALGRQVALKLLRPDLARDASLVESFRTEAATLARIRHPNLVQVYAFGLDAGHVYFAMELIEGQGLDHRIHSARKRRRYLPVHELLGYITEVAGALEAVHRGGMVHRDVKPENILLDRIHRRSVLVDVGIAVRRGGASRAGTPGFTAPEVFDGAAGTPRSDVYSLGALAYVLLTTRPPFGDGSGIEILTRQATQRPAMPSDLRHDLPSEIDEILIAALAPDPADRPASARGLADALVAVLDKPELMLRLTMERPIVYATAPKRIVSFDPSSPKPSPSSPPSSRGVLFRAAYEALGARRGAAWIAEVSRRHPQVAHAITPQSSMFSWHATDAFEAVLASLGGDGERESLARQLGQQAVELSLRQFFGASPTAAGAAQVIRSADLLWRCYHTWGTISVIAHASDAQVTLTEGRSNVLLCAATAGMLAGMVEGTGGQVAAVEHPMCVARGAPRCVFDIRWS
jgi:diguanylate cyclase (GGDEF)-like protein